MLLRQYDLVDDVNDAVARFDIRLDHVGTVDGDARGSVDIDATSLGRRHHH